MSQSVSFQAVASDALVFWERGRVIYNAILLMAVLTVQGLDVVNWNAFGLSLPELIVMAMAANVLYCAGYPADLLVQMSRFRAPWRHGRWLLWALGTGFALMLALLFLLGQLFQNSP